MKNKSPLGYKIVTGILVVIIVLLTARAIRLAK